MATRIKKKASSYVCTSREAAQADIKTLGDLQREHARLTADLNDKIAELTEAAAPNIDALSERIKTLQGGVQTWCEANREQLCGKGKSANLITGEIAWRQRPPSVRITGVAAVVENLNNLGLGRFVRTKNEPNKDAMLNEPEAVKGVAGITIVTGVEDFVITPFEVEAP